MRKDMGIKILQKRVMLKDVVHVDGVVFERINRGRRF